MQKIKMKKILCIGTATVDIISVVPDENIEKISFANSSNSFLMLESGRKLEAQKISWYFGGGAVNASIAMKRLGIKSSCLVKIGKDTYGKQILQHLNENGINTDNVIVDDSDPTAISILISLHDKNPTIITDRGANTEMKIDELNWNLIKDYDAFYITNLSGESAHIFDPLINFAKNNNIAVISNPGIRQLSENNNFVDTLNSINMLVINLVEAQELLTTFLNMHLIIPAPTKSDDEVTIHSGKVIVRMVDFLAKINALGVELIAITDGKNGAYLYHEGAMHHILLEKVKSIGTVGAGDSFTSTLATLWLDGMDIKNAGYLAAKNAASVVQTIDAQSGLLNYEDLLQQ